MALPKPSNFQAKFEPLVGDKVTVALTWNPVPRAHHYVIYRDAKETIEVNPPYDTMHVDGEERIVYRDLRIWYKGQYLDLYYWVAAVEEVIDPVTNEVTYVEGELTDALTTIHPRSIRLIERTRSLLGDDLRVFNDKSNIVLEQISVYNYKLALDEALDDFNSTPTFTDFNYGTLPERFSNVLVQGTLVFLLPRLILFEQAKQMKFEDQGQSWTPPDLSEALKRLHDFYKETYKEKRTEVKHNIRPVPIAVGSLKSFMIAPNLLRWRHVPYSRPWF